MAGAHRTRGVDHQHLRHGRPPHLVLRVAAHREQLFQGCVLVVAEPVCPVTADHHQAAAEVLDERGQPLRRGRVRSCHVDEHRAVVVEQLVLGG